MQEVALAQCLHAVREELVCQLRKHRTITHRVSRLECAAAHVRERLLHHDLYAEFHERVAECERVIDAMHGRDCWQCQLGAFLWQHS